LIALPAYVLVQAVPLPVAALARISPHRAALAAALERIGVHQSFAAISLDPAETLVQLSRVCACALVFLAVRNLVWREPERAWRLAVPLIAVASAEAALGLAQAFDAPDGFAHGTYVNRNHFAGLLEMALPFAVTYPFRAMRRRRGAFEAESLKSALRACLSMTAAALMLAGITYSLSRSGFTVALLALGLMGAMAAAVRLRGRVRNVAMAAIAAAVITLFAMLPTDRLIERFRQLAASERLTSDTRAQIWSDTARLIADYPMTGVGAGAFAEAFYEYHTHAVDVLIDYAHNDYLQGLAELGVIGFVLIAALVAGLRSDAAHALRRASYRSLTLAAVGALAALAMHSVTDFNLYIPANALMAAWVAGILCGVSIAGSEHRFQRNLCALQATYSPFWPPLAPWRGPRPTSAR
jgi:O-antigen ligase